MTALADVQGTLVRLCQRLAEVAPVAWRHDPLFRGASVGAGVTLALLLLRLVGPHNPDLDAPTVHYDATTRQAWIGSRNATALPQPLAPSSPPRGSGSRGTESAFQRRQRRLLSRHNQRRPTHHSNHSSQTNISNPAIST